MKIIAAVHRVAQGRDAVALGAALAEATGGELLVTNVYQWHWSAPVWGAVYERALRDQAQVRLDEVLRDVEVRCHSRVVGDESAALGLQRLVEEERADVLVVGSSHRGRVGRAMLGGVGEHLAQGLSCALAVAPRGYADGAATLRHVGVAYDGTAAADAALRWAVALGLRTGATLTLYRALQFPHLAWTEELDVTDVQSLFDDIGLGQRREVEAALRHVPVELEPRFELLQGPAAAALAQAASRDDLLVTGSRGHRRVSGLLLGHVTRSLLHRATCPVVVLPPDPSARAAFAVPAGAADQRSPAR